MRFKKGTKVEVWTLKEGPSGSWGCAEITGSNSHHYTVRYEGEFGKSTVERVSRKMIRPYPPPVEVLQDWVPGDVVEVLHNFCWKMATILKVSKGNHLVVSLLGSAVEFKVNRCDIRARICWLNDEWVVIGKAASNRCEDLRFRFPSSQNYNNEARNLKGDKEFIRNTNIFMESQAIPMKRPISRVHSRIEPYEMPNKKKIRLGNEFHTMQQSQLPKKVESVASSREMLHDNFMLNGNSKMIMERRKTKGIGPSHYIDLVSTDDDRSVASSVASCSVYRNPWYKTDHVFPKGQYEDNNSECSDAESCCYLRSEEGNSILPQKEEVIDEIRRLELHAYRCTIGALYASGPLSWEQELLLTNLRDSLHISNDEHLTEIRNLVSSSS